MSRPPCEDRPGSACRNERSERAKHANEVSWIEPGALAARLARAARPLIIDVRGADEFDGDLAHLADARNIALPELLGKVDDVAGHRDRELILIGRTHQRSAGAALRLDDAGVRNVAVLRGGMVEWRGRGLPVAGTGSLSSA